MLKKAEHLFDVIKKELINYGSSYSNFEKVRLSLINAESNKDRWWRYIPDSIKEVWTDLPLVCRMAFFFSAEIITQSERDEDG